jgi:ubiquinone/menaquinone biosynthesis C-methylase UbiE
MREKLKIKEIYESEAPNYFAKRKFYFSYVGARMLIVMNAVIDRMSKISDCKILNIGAGPGFFERSSIKIDNVTTWVSLDIANSMSQLIRGIHPMIHVVVADAEHLPFRDNAFDIVLMSRVLKFLGPEKALGESRRVTKKFLILFVDVADTLWVQVAELLGITVDPAVWNNHRTPSGKEIETFLRSFFIKLLKLHITALPLSFFNFRLIFFSQRVLEILDKSLLGSRVISYVLLKNVTG